MILVLHSYGAWPGSRAVKGFDTEARRNAGKKTSIVEVVFVAAFIIADNALKKQYSYLPPWLDVKDNARRLNEQAIPLLFGDMDEATAKKWIAKSAWQYNDFDDDEIVPDASWKLSVPKTYIVTMNDETAHTTFQLDMLKSVINRTWAIKTIPSGREPFLSRPKDFVQVLLQPVIR